MAESDIKISVDVSMYPLCDDYIDVIESFIQALHKHPIKVITNTMSTQVFGNMDDVWNALNEGIKSSFANQEKVAYTLKVITNDLDPASDPFNGKYVD